ncbi:MAG: tRNA(Ile)-lysidine synthase [Gammaproteobacteria bacterium]|nr:tRNA(Ile)-lysidine synthase [Gammaproteobacteria bacterium]
MPAQDASVSLCSLVREALASLPPPCHSALAVAYSGGRDSTVLLHVLREIAAPGTIRAIHVHHNLHPLAERWADLCARQCAEWNIPLELLRIDARPPRGESPEAWARRARYEALGAALRQGEALLTAHHQQDQAETLLLQLVRGAGPAGLSAMPRLTGLGGRPHLRPLIDAPASLIADYAGERRLTWVEDPSNAETRYDRNFVRRRVLPVLEERWPRAAATVARAATWQAEAADLLHTLAGVDLAAAAGATPHRLRLEALTALPASRRHNLLRGWLKGLALPLPSAAQLREVDRMLAARRDGAGCTRWRGVELRRFHDELIAMSPLPRFTPGGPIPWRPGEQGLWLPAGTLTASRRRGGGLAQSALAGRRTSVRYRAGGERLRLRAAGPARPLKLLLQEWRVPPWLRDRLPLLYLEDALAAVADRAIAAEFQAGPGAEGWELEWAWNAAHAPP